MADIIIIAVVAIIVAAVVAYIVSQKKKGVKCIGCPCRGSCAGKCGDTDGGKENV